MKRYGYLYDKICSMENLELAFRHAKKGKGWYKEVKQIEERPYYYLAALQWMLKNHKYRTSEYTTFTKKDGKKEREIYKLPFFPDRIAQWAVLQVIEPQLLAYFTDDTYSAIPNRGIHAAFKKLRKAVDTVPEEMTYCLKIDCKKFYPSIDHDTLKRKFRRKYKDPELLALIDEIIDSISTCPATEENIEFYRSCGNEIKIVQYGGKDFIDGVGIPIGNYFSQYDGNFFLTDFDHWIKEVEHVKHYYRYMDDICIFAKSKEELHQLLQKIDNYFRVNLKLRIKGNYQIFPSFVRGIDFVGYRVFLNNTLLRKSTCQEFKRKMTAIRKKVERGQETNYSEWCSINSYKGWLKHCDSYRLSEQYIVPIQPYADEYYKTHIKAKKKKGGKGNEAVRKGKKRSAA
ncbi:MAG: reverse transcriptase domain-containing protein [Streptococcus sp.]|uniref:RNA-directed DNA polymerase n=1 Tax=Streptococcus sp. TaxID=1306 RepID=UPI0039951F58